MEGIKLSSNQEICVNGLKKYTAISLALLMFVFAASAQISTFSDSGGNLVFENSTGDTVFNITRGGGVNMDAKEINNFFDQTQCASDEAIKTINPNGSYECNQLSSTTQAENLSETLAAGNIANETILAPDGVAIGGDADGTGSASAGGRKQVAIGTFSGTGSNSNTVSLGYSASNSGSGSVAVGSFTDADGSGVAIGGDAQAKSGSVSIGYYANDETSYTTGSNAIAIGNNANSVKDGSVAIGHSSNAPNQYEATFGNLNGQELDVNVTGNLTVHGSGGLSFEDGSAVVSFGDNYNIYGDKYGGVGGITIGDSSTSPGGTGALTIGKGASTATGGTAVGNGADGSQRGAALGSNAVSGGYGVAVGGASDGSSYGIALGDSASTSAEGAVAIGYNSNSPNQYEATFGNLQGQELDVNVTGNMTVHGSGGISFNSRAIRIGSGTATNYVGDIAIGKGADADDGYDVNADRAVALGQDAKATGVNGATALGDAAEATDDSATAVGSQATALDFATAIGYASNAASDATAIGVGSDASGSHSFSAGKSSDSAGSYSIALGHFSSTSAEGAVAIGYESTAPTSYEATFGNLQGEELDVNVTGNATVHQNMDVKGDLNVGGELTGVSVSGGETENLSETLAAGNVANQSISLASGTAVEIGTSTSTNDPEDIAIGRSAEASANSYTGYPETAVGYQSTASAFRASAFGESSTASGSRASAFGSSSSASGSSASAFGESTTASGGRPSAFGVDSTASGNSPSAFGEGSTASNDYTSAFGASSSATGLKSSAFGGNTEASAEGSLVLGYRAGDGVTEGKWSVALGSDPFPFSRGSTAATGKYSMALGPQSKASNENAVAVGFNATAPNAYEATFGNLQGEELDVNVTGNLTVHGSELSFTDNPGDVQSIGFESSSLNPDDLVIEAQDYGGSSYAGDVRINGGESGIDSADGRVVLGDQHTSAVNIGTTLDMGYSNITNSSGGNVTVGQDLKVEGDVYSTGADLAEIYSSHQELESGELVMLSDRKEVERTENADSSPVGVVSTDPGQVLNYNKDGYQIALEGKVPVKVDGKVKQGERIVASDTPGVATSCKTENPSETLDSNSSTDQIVDAVKQLEKDQECLEDSIGVAMESGSGKVEVKLE